MREYEADITTIEHCCGSTWRLALGCPDIAANIRPGQFVQIRVSDATDPFLRRTFSVSGADREHGLIHLLVDIVGKGTEILCSTGRTPSVNVIGPLGTGFDTAFVKHGPVIMVGGGTGAAPLLFLAHVLTSETGAGVHFLMGAPTASGLATVDGRLSDSVRLGTATDDGSRGYHGFVTGLLDEMLETVTPSVIYTCGPHPMMKEVAKISTQTGVPCQVSLEERMACGFGVCLGCAVPRPDGGMVRSCVEGPVFNADEVVL